MAGIIWQSRLQCWCNYLEWNKKQSIRNKEICHNIKGVLYWNIIYRYNITSSPLLEWFLTLCRVLLEYENPNTLCYRTSLFTFCMSMHKTSLHALLEALIDNLAGLSSFCWYLKRQKKKKKIEQHPKFFVFNDIIIGLNCWERIIMKSVF